MSRTATSSRSSSTSEGIRFDPAQRRFLDAPLIARLALVGEDGYPHVVPVWYLRDGDDLLITSFRATRKVRLLERDPRCALSIGGDPYGAEGYLLQGAASIEADQDLARTAPIVRRYEAPDQAARYLADWAGSDVVIIRIRLVRIVRT